MARYIDADALTEELKLLSIMVTGLLCGKTQLTLIVEEYKKSFLKLIDEQPTADVAPRSEVAREIFEEVENALSDNFHADCQMGDCIEDYYDDNLRDDLAELKKKYTEGK